MRARSGLPFDILRRCRDELRADPQVAGGVGVIGFCMGGSFALLMSADGFDASSVNYGMVPEDVDEIFTKLERGLDDTLAWAQRERLL